MLWPPHCTKTNKLKQKITNIEAFYNGVYKQSNCFKTSEKAHRVVWAQLDSFLRGDPFFRPNLMLVPRKDKKMIGFFRVGYYTLN